MSVKEEREEKREEKREFNKREKTRGEMKGRTLKTRKRCLVLNTYYQSG